MPRYTATAEWTVFAESEEQARERVMAVIVEQPHDVLLAIKDVSKDCAHGCGAAAGNDGYCDECYADGCLVGPDGLCRYTVNEGSEA